MKTKTKTCESTGHEESKEREREEGIPKSLSKKEVRASREYASSWTYTSSRDR